MLSVKVAHEGCMRRWGGGGGNNRVIRGERGRGGEGGRGRL